MASAESQATHPTPGQVAPSLTGPGPHNPAASLPPKVVKRILELVYVDISELAVDEDLGQYPGRPHALARLPVTDISTWVEQYSLMAAVLAVRFPAKAPELQAYLATIVRAERNYEDGRWVAYDRQFCREALARRDLNWSATNPRLYNEAFTGRACPIRRCSVCLQESHLTHNCPRNPHHPGWGWPPDPIEWSGHSQPHFSSPQRQSHEVCRRFNEGKCKMQRCRYRHTCSRCQGAHPQVDCPHGGMFRSRSPANPLRGPAPLLGPPGPRH